MWPFRKRRMTEGEFLRHVMRSVTYDGREIDLQPPKLKSKMIDDVAVRADRTLRELLRMVKTDVDVVPK
jgi:hypothetical protein